MAERSDQPAESGASEWCDRVAFWFDTNHSLRFRATHAGVDEVVAPRASLLMGSIGHEAWPYGSGSTLRRLSLRWDLVLFIGALAMLTSARIVFDRSVGRFPGSTLVVAILVSAGSVIALMVGISRMLASAGSHLRHVFCSRYLLASGLVMSTVAFVLAGSLLLDDPFRQLLSTGRISPLVVAEVGSVGGVAACLAGASIAFVTAWEELQKERRW